MGRTLVDYIKERITPKKNTHGVEVGDTVQVGFYLSDEDGWSTDKWKNVKGVVTSIDHESNYSDEDATIYIQTSSGKEWYYYGDKVTILMKNREHRLKVINQIINEIASRGRNFFRNNKTGKIAKLFIRNNKIFYECEWVGDNNIHEICLSIPEYRNFKGWFHGGTLKALIKEFKHYVMTGISIDQEEGRAGLYCTYWGYEEVDMVAIRELAIKLGYLKPN